MRNMNITILGGGTMGAGIAKQLQSSDPKMAKNIRLLVRRREHAEALTSETGLSVHTDLNKALAGADLLLISVKPQDLQGLSVDIRKAMPNLKDKLVISIAAGVSLSDLSEIFGAQTPLVRAMPNTPCLIGAGMTVLSFAATLSESHQEQASQLFAPLGEVMVIGEEHMDTVTGLSASGPAFTYVMIEALADGGIMCGLPRSVATTLAAQVLKGAASMVLQTGRHPADLKDDVTTPAGCTIGALLHLEDGRIRSVLARGVEEAARISKGLSPRRAKRESDE